MRKKRKKSLLKLLTLTGCFSTGIIYASIGIIAILSFLQLKKGGADESSFFALLDSFLIGRIVNWLIIVGALCFIIWRLYEAFKDPYNLGSNIKGIMLRMGAAFSSVADAFIAFSVFQVLFSEQPKTPQTGVPVQQRAMVARWFENDWGPPLVAAMAVMVLITALILAFYGLSKNFTETINVRDFSKVKRKIVHGLAYAGYLSRGIILGIVGYSLLRAALTLDSNKVVNTDKAFDFIGDHIGHVFFLLVATGTICYGIYMFVLGLHYDIDADEKITA